MDCEAGKIHGGDNSIWARRYFFEGWRLKWLLTVVLEHTIHHSWGQLILIKSSRGISVVCAGEIWYWSKISGRDQNMLNYSTRRTLEKSEADKRNSLVNLSCDFLINETWRNQKFYLGLFMAAEWIAFDVRIWCSFGCEVLMFWRHIKQHGIKCFVTL